MARVLWFSNAPWTSTGYGNQTGLVCAFLPAHGHQLAVLANFGLHGTRIDVQGIKVYPAGREARSNDLVQACADDWQAEVIVSLYDAWSLDFAKKGNTKTPWVAWLPVDHETVPPPVVESLKHAAGVVAFSRHGQKALAAAGIEAAYIPHGANTKVFCPGDQAAARARFGFAPDKFLVGMVAANNYYPSRKCIPQVLAAFAQLRSAFDDVALYLHMVDDESKDGVNVQEIARSLDLKIGEDVLLADQFGLQMGYPPNVMADLYRALDVLANPSFGEGFGIPILESLACGTPVLATNTTAMTELVAGVGWLVPGDPWWSRQGAWQRMPRVGDIAKRLANAYMEKRCTPEAWAERSERCRQRGVEYDFETVVAPAWDEYLRSESWKVPHCRAGHDWAPTGIWEQVSGDGVSGRVLLVPCRRWNCSAHLRVAGPRNEEIIPAGFGMQVGDVQLDLEDDLQGGVAKTVCREIAQDYDLDSIPFQDGDVAVDIGAHVGVVSIYLAKRWPGLRVIAYEPSPENYARLVRNIRANGVGGSVTAINRAVTGDGRTVRLSGDPERNSGGLSIYGHNGTAGYEVESVTLAQLFAEHQVERCKLLKVDCEGAEIEILGTQPGLLDQVETLRGEFHVGNGHSQADVDELIWRIGLYLPPERVKVKVISVGDKP